MNQRNITAGLVIITLLSAGFLCSNTVSADTSVTKNAKITVPAVCSISATGTNSHSTEIEVGRYKSDIGTTTATIMCNDHEGFAIYAAGYTGNEVSDTNSNKLVGTSLSSNAVIESGIATSAGNPDVSNWVMKLAITQDSGDTTSPNNFAIDSAPNVYYPSKEDPSTAQASFANYHVVPNEYVKVAHKNSSTDMTLSTGGVKLTTTYAAYISNTQPADTYTGQVIYTLVHPSNHTAPASMPVTLDTGKTINSKLKSLAATVVSGQDTTIAYNTQDNYVKSLNVHLKTSAPTGFTPSEKNTISSSTSRKPIYIVFDNTNDAGIMHFYTEGDQIVLPADSSYAFYSFRMLSDFSALSDWDSSNVTNMISMFQTAGYSATTFSLDLSSWDTSNVTNMGYMFQAAGYSTTTWSIGDLSSWDTSKVTRMDNMFFYAGEQAATFSLDLSSWDTSSVTNMNNMFHQAGYSATTWSIGDLSTWNTSSVTSMSKMFHEAGYSATTWSIGDLSSWNTSSATDMSNMFTSAGYSATTWSIGDLSSWNTSSVTNMGGMFGSAGYRAATWSIGDLSSWNTSSVTNMDSMFYYAGYSATTWSIGDLSSWNTSKVTNMSSMFSYAGYSATTFSLDLSSWDTSSVTYMYYMFSNAGRSATTWSIGDLSSWDTSKVTRTDNMFQSAGYSATTFSLDLSSWDTSKVTAMTNMFYSAGYSATTWSVTIPQTNGSSITNTASRLYGKTTSKYATPPSGKSFTLAQ